MNNDCLSTTTTIYAFWDFIFVVRFNFRLWLTTSYGFDCLSWGTSSGFDRSRKFYTSERRQFNSIAEYFESSCSLVSLSLIHFQILLRQTSAVVLNNTTDFYRYCCWTQQLNNNSFLKSCSFMHVSKRIEVCRTTVNTNNELEKVLLEKYNSAHFILSLSLSMTHTHTYTFSLCISLSQTHILHFLCLSHSLSHTHILHSLCLSLSHTSTHTHSLSLTHTLSLSLSLSHIHTHTHTLSLSLSTYLTYSISHTLSLTLSLTARA